MIDQTARLHSRLVSSRTIEETTKALLEYYKANDLHTREYVTSKGVKIVCRQGCTYCCNIKVDVRPPEVFLISKYIKENFSSERRANLLETLQAHANHLARITANDHLSSNVPCPMLLGNSCSIYSVRPIACRAYHSLDTSSCKYSFENPTDLIEKRETDPYLDSFWGESRSRIILVFHDLDYDMTAGELGTMLLRSIRNQKVQKRWLNKQKAFEGLRAYLAG